MRRRLTPAPPRPHLVAIAAAVYGVVAVSAAEAAGLTSPEPLAKAYELILDARFEEADRQLRQACPPAPSAACEVITAVVAYWRVLLDQENTSRDAGVLSQINTAITSTEAWAAREPTSAEPWFYLGGAYGTRVLLRGLRAQHLAAARDGRRIHHALQQAVRLDPSLRDAYLGLGLYHYYAAVAPRVARILSALLFLPAGDRAGGLREMEQTRSQGVLLRGETDYQLHLIYLWYEQQPATALRLVEGLQARYPHNPVFPLRRAQVLGDYMRNHAAALQVYRELFESARAARVADADISATSAQLGMAQEMDALCETSGAIAQLRAVIARTPAAPYAALARAYFQLGVALDRAGRRADASAAFQQVLTSTPIDDRLRLRSRARDATKNAQVPRACG